MEYREDGISTFYAADSTSWRQWLEINHDQEKSVWLIIYHKDSPTPSVDYHQAVDEALCFGWVDSKPNKRDGESYFQFFAKRNPKSNWSKVNKEKVALLTAAGKMAPAGLAMVNQAKESGTWDALNQVEALILPEDLTSAFAENSSARQLWENFPPSTKRGILEWIFNAKRPETRQKRIMETVTSAAKNIRANQYRQPKGK